MQECTLHKKKKKRFDDVLKKTLFFRFRFRCMIYAVKERKN